MAVANKNSKDINENASVQHIDTRPAASAADQEGQDESTSIRKREKSLVRKLDMTLMPVIWLLYLFNYLDRNNIAQAKLNGLEADLGLKDEQYNTAISILNVGYILMQLPSNMILTRVRPSLYIPLWVCIWSCLSAATAAVHNYGQLVAIRFCLGFAEAPFFPGAFYLLSCWYTKKELALRTAVVYSGLVLATAFSGLLAAGIFAGLDGARGLEGWRWLFIIEGAGSFAAGVISISLIPDFPQSLTGSAKWLLSTEERELAWIRIRNDQVSNQESNDSVWFGLKSALSDYRVFVFALMLCANHTAYGFNNFYPTIVEGFHLGSTTVTLLCTAPPYIVGTVVSFYIAWSSDRHNERGFHISGSMGTAIIGYIISVSLTNTGGQYFSSFLYVSGCFAANSLVYTWAASAVSQTPEKRACATAIINLLGQLGNIWSPYFFRGQDAPRYILALILMIAFAGLSIMTCATMKWSLRRDNKTLVAQYETSAEKPTLHTL